MASLDSVLRKLNKGKKDEDKSGILGDVELVRTVTSSGSPYLDYKTNGTYLDGGYNTIVGDGGAGKSSLALLACADVQRRGKIAVYYDGEGTLNDSYIQRMGVDKTKLIYEKGRNLEEMLDTVELYCTADEVGIIIIDSIPIFTSTTVEEKSASENNMAVEARRFSQRMPVIEGYAMNRGVCIIGLTSYKESPGAYGDPRYLSRGNWQKTMSNTILDLTRKEFILDEDKKSIGHVLDVRVKKIKNGAYDPKEVIKLNFYYDGGFYDLEENSRLFLENGILIKSGGWYSFPNKDGEEIRVQGLNSMFEYLDNNKEDYEFLLNQLKND